MNTNIYYHLIRDADQAIFYSGKELEELKQEHLSLDDEITAVFVEWVVEPDNGNEELSEARWIMATKEGSPENAYSEYFEV